jgi:hypothetical protein
LEPLWLARVNDYKAGGEQLTAADLQNRKTHEANYNARSLQEILLAFRTARKSLLECVETLEHSLFSCSREPFRTRD